MNQKAKAFLANVLRAMSANVVRLLLSIALTLILPRLLSVEEYSAWQLYLLYGTYFAYSSLGWCEGMVLKYGGQHYEDLRKPVISSQFWMLALYEVGFLLVAGVVIFSAGVEAPKWQLMSLACLSSVFDILRYMLQSVLHASGRIKEYARILILERVFFSAVVFLVLALGFASAYVLILIEIGSRIVAFLFALWICRDVLFVKPIPPRPAFAEARSLIGIGYRLLLANLASTMIIGIVRMAIESKWGLVTFGKVSLTLSMANMLVTCISAIGVVLFPSLRRMSRQRLEELYPMMRALLTIPVMGVLLLYVPGKWLLQMWLPQYADSLQYLAVLLPMCVYEARTHMLINTYLKVYRREADILKTNVLSVLFSLALTGLTVYWIGNLDLAVLTIMILMIVKAALSEFYLTRQLSFSALRRLIPECLLTAAFILTSWGLSGWFAMGGYLICYLVYLLASRGDIRVALPMIKKVLFDREGSPQTQD